MVGSGHARIRTARPGRGRRGGHLYTFIDTLVRSGGRRVRTAAPFRRIAPANGVGGTVAAIGSDSTLDGCTARGPPPPACRGDAERVALPGVEPDPGNRTRSTSTTRPRLLADGRTALSGRDGRAAPGERGPRASRPLAPGHAARAYFPDAQAPRSPAAACRRAEVALGPCLGSDDVSTRGAGWVLPTVALPRRRLWGAPGPRRWPRCYPRPVPAVFGCDVHCDRGRPDDVTVVSVSSAGRIAARAWS